MKLKQTQFDSELTRSVSLLRGHDVDSDEYATILGRVEKLHELRKDEKPKPVSLDTALSVGANLFGILMIIKHENINVITSKALSFVHRVK